MKSRKKIGLKKKKEIIILNMALLLSICLFGAIARAKNTKEEPFLHKYYTSVQIHPGDTLWDIATQYCHNSAQIKDYMQELRRINHLSGDKIHAGRYLTVVYYSEEYK